MVKLQLESNRQPIQRRLNWLYPPLVLIFVLLAVRLWWLQILQGAEYTRLAEQNRIRSIQVVAPRGPILDRNHIPLVDNRPSMNIVLYRELMKDPSATVAFVTEKLGISAEDLAAQLRRNKRAGTYQPIVIKEDVGIEDVSIVEAHKREHPEIQLGPEPRRLYRFGNLAAHVLGYVGEISEDDLAGNVFPGVQGGELVGRSGVERTYNQCLMGQNGAREVLVDSLGRELGMVAERDAVIGGDLQLTLDFDLQSQAESLLAGSVGTIVAMDPRNGEILAMAGAPSFNPNSFSSRISAKDWNALMSDPDLPLLNRAIQNTYPPGSIFKLVMAEAGLAEGFVDDSTHVICHGAAPFYGRVFHCWWEPGHGYINLEGAITNSCNIFFYTLGERMGIEKIAQHAKALGFGEGTGIDLRGEQIGVVPSPEWKQQVRHEKWYAGETISVSIGQGPIRATPLQVLRAVSAIATDGKLIMPHLLLHAERGPAPDRWPEQQLPIKPENARKIRAGMWGSVNNYGTGHSAALPGLDICGKTGTVQVISAERKKEIKTDPSDVANHAWFAGFASRDNPEIAVVVFLEHGGGGGAKAAPMAREIFRTYFAKKDHPELISQAVVRPAGGEVR
ncbi:MAG: penicillin-binding protein 2 [Acidobacteriia bacterium]|nr:penicillin-binding protein 2 [Terriglobia bacterium]